MRVFILILAGLWISATLCGCSINRAASLRMLDARAEYEDPKIQGTEPNLREAGVAGFEGAPVPVRSRPKVASIWIHPHEMASHDYFWGGWMSVVVEADQWILSKPQGWPPATGIGRFPETKPKLKTK